MRPKRAYKRRVEQDCASSSIRLRHRVDGVAIDENSGPRDLEGTGLEVHGIPPEPRQLAAPQPPSEQQGPRRYQPVIDHRAEECPGLIGSPGCSNALGCLGSRPAEPRQRITTNHASFERPRRGRLDEPSLAHGT